MRIVAGALGGRRLHAPRGLETRPTSDKVRQAVFNVLGPPPEGAEVLDLYAGSGAMGLEALSRGAARAVLVDKARPALEAIRRNVAELALDAQVVVVGEDVGRAVQRLAAEGRRFTWIFVDPPYAAGVLERTLGALGPLLPPEGLVVAEHASRHPLPDRCGILRVSDRRRYGETEVSFMRPEAIP